MIKLIDVLIFRSSVLVAFAIVILATAVDITIRFKSKHEMDIDEVIRKKSKYMFLLKKFHTCNNIVIMFLY